MAASASLTRKPPTGEQPLPWMHASASWPCPSRDAALAGRFSYATPLRTCGTCLGCMPQLLGPAEAEALPLQAGTAVQPLY
eukprot:1157451-Pelagomonas_calceolata.AAC.9